MAITGLIQAGRGAALCVLSEDGQRWYPFSYGGSGGDGVCTRLAARRGELYYPGDGLDVTDRHRMMIESTKYGEEYVGTSIILVWYDHAEHIQRAGLVKVVEIAGVLRWEVETEICSGLGSAFWDKVEAAIKTYGRKFLTIIAEDWQVIRPWQMERMIGLSWPAAEDKIKETLYGWK